MMVALGAVHVGPLPSLGHLLDPVYGIWAVARGAEMPRRARGRIRGLDAGVDVQYDSRAVPHIFATSEDDAYRALGYVVARDRLFQIELQGRSGAGTLTELVGAAALPLDRETRALGLPGAAERAFAALIRDRASRTCCTRMPTGSTRGSRS
jgi:penicillin G amidase